MADGADKPPPRSAVGYRRPPEQHRFKKGVSGNPLGRPRKHRQQQSPGYASAVEELVLREAYRPITVRENGEPLELPMIQAVVRSLGVAAVKGSHRAQIAVTELVRVIEEKTYETKRDYVLTMLEYKQGWQEVFDRCDRNHEPRPDPFPHPDDIQVNMRTAEVIYNGPFFEDQRAAWDKLKVMREEAQQEIVDLTKRARRQPDQREHVDRIIASNQRIIDRVDNTFPDEATRRVPGFNIDEWRARQAKLQKLKDKYRRERARTGPLE